MQISPSSTANKFQRGSVPSSLRMSTGVWLMKDFIQKHVIVPGGNEVRACGRNKLYVDGAYPNSFLFPWWCWLWNEGGPNYLTIQPRRAMQVRSHTQMTLCSYRATFVLTTSGCSMSSWAKDRHCWGLGSWITFLYKFPFLFVLNLHHARNSSDHKAISIYIHTYCSHS